MNGFNVYVASDFLLLLSRGYTDLYNNTLTADYEYSRSFSEYSRSFYENLSLPIQMQLS